MDKMKQTRKLGKIRTALVGLAALAGSFVAGCGSTGRMFEPSVYVDTTFVSDYVARHGAAIRGQQRQDLVNVNVNDRLSMFMWQNYSHKEGEFNERDFGLSYTLPLPKELTKAGLSARVGYEYWNYPTGTLGKDDQVLKAGVGYGGSVNLDLDVTQLMKHDDVPNGTRFALKASKPITLYEDKDKKFALSLTPSVSTAITDNYYGKTMAFPHVTPGINFGVTKKIGKATFGAGLFVNHQFALPEGKKNGIESFTWGGIGLNFAW